MSEEGKESLAICQGIEARRAFETNMKKVFEKGTLNGVQGGAGYFLLPMFTKEKGCQQLGAFRHFCADPSPRNCSAFKSEQLQLLPFSL